MKKFRPTSPNLSPPGKKPKETAGHIAPVTLVRETVRIIQRYRSLLWLGILAGLGQGFGVNPEILQRLGRSQSNLWEDFLTSLNNLAPGFLLLILIVVGAIFLTGLVAEAGLMQAVSYYQGHKEEETFRSNFMKGVPFLWPLLKLILIFLLTSMTIFFLLAVPAIQLLGRSSSIGQTTGLIGLLLAVTFGLVIGLVYPWATRFLVLQDEAVGQSLRSAWRMVRQFPGTVIRIILVGLFIQAAALLLIAPLLVLTISLVFLRGELTFAPLILLPVFLIGGIMTAFKNAYLTLAFIELNQHVTQGG